MAYPDAILTTGILDTYSDIFEYFKGATQAFLEGDYQAEYNSEYWNPNFVQAFASGANYPITRGQFNTIINNSFPDSSELLSENDPVSGWPIDKVNDWAKIKCFQLALFGSVSGSTSQSSLSYITGSREVTTSWRLFDQNYLRLALVRFDTYGTCYEDDASAPAPTNLVTNVSARTFDWTNATGYPNLSSYQYYMNDGVWHTVSNKPIVIPDAVSVPVGGFAVRVKGSGYYSSSDELYNDDEMPELGIVVFVQVVCEFDGANITAHATCTVNQPMPEEVVIQGFATYYLVDGNGSYTFPYDMVIDSGSSSGDSGNYPVTGGPVDDIDYTEVNSGEAIPNEVGPGPEIVEVTW